MIRNQKTKCKSENTIQIVTSDVKGKEHEELTICHILDHVVKFELYQKILVSHILLVLHSVQTVHILWHE